MQANQQQQSQSARKQATQNPVDAKIQDLILCPNCGAELPGESLFCSECSATVKQHVCPKCGHPNTWTSDICQYCGTWLLQKQCKFCYAELDDEASFCPECGKPKEGIPCPHCGTLSIFDFCPKCGKPVTEEAAAELQAAQAESPPVPPDPQMVAMEAELAQLEAVINSVPEPVYVEPVVKDDYDDVYDPDDYFEESPEEEPEVIIEEPVRKTLFSDKQMASIRQAGADIDSAQRERAEEARIAEERRQAQIAEQKRQAQLAEERRQAQIAEQRRQDAARQAAQMAAQKAEAQRNAQEAERRRQADEAERQRQVREAQAKKEALQRKIDQDKVAARAAQKDREIAVAKQNASRRFMNNQEARNWHNARRHPDALGWLCNAYGNVHLYSDGGPNQCNEPAKGGCDYFGELVRDGYCYKPKR